MAEIEYIKHLYKNEDKSLREIARITESDFRTNTAEMPVELNAISYLLGTHKYPRPLDGMEEFAACYREIIKSNIEYDFMARRHGMERVDEVVELMLEVVLDHFRRIEAAGG